MPPSRAAMFRKACKNRSCRTDRSGSASVLPWRLTGRYFLLFLQRFRAAPLVHVIVEAAAIAVCGPAQADDLRPFSQRSRRHEVGTQLEGEIAGQHEGEQSLIDFSLALLPDDLTEPRGFILGEAQFDDRACNVPAHVLVADEIMGSAMVERVRLD